MKKLLLILVVLLILGLAGGVLVLDRAARGAVEHGGEYALGVGTTLEGASVGLFSGDVDLSGLAIDNPDGFEGEFLTLGTAGLGVALGSLLDDEVQVRRFELKDITLSLTRNDLGSNYGAILAHLERFESAGGGSGGGSSEPADDAGQAKRFLVDEIHITGVRAELDLLPELGEQGRATIVVPEILLTGLDSESFTAAELMDLLVKALLGAVAEGGAGLLPEGLLGDLQGQLAGLSAVPTEIVGEVLGGLQGGAEELEGAAKDAAQEALDALQDGKSVEEVTDDMERDAKDSLKEAGKKLDGLFGGSKDDGR